MTRYLLDTNVVSDFVRGVAGVVKSIASVAPTECAVSTITVMEVEYGLALVPERAKRVAPVLGELFRAIRVISFGRSDARAAGAVRASLRKRGRPIGPYDALLAGTALARGLVLVTANEAELRRVDALRIENWRG